MGGARHRQKGNRTERQLVDLHKAIGVHAERYALSGASRFAALGMTLTSMRMAESKLHLLPR